MRNDRIIEKEIRINAASKIVFNALISPSLIKQWWYVNSAIVIPQKNGVYALTWGDSLDNPDFITVSRLTEFDFGKKLVMTNESYYSPHGGLPFDSLLVATFTLVQGQDSTVLKILQEGIPKAPTADQFYEDTVKGWETTLKSLKNVVEDEAKSVAHILEAE